MEYSTTVYIHGTSVVCAYELYIFWIIYLRIRLCLVDRHLPLHIHKLYVYACCSWWRHQMETFSALLALCVGNSPATVNSPYNGQWRGALMFSLIFAYKGLSKQTRRRWFETPLGSSWRHCNVIPLQWIRVQSRFWNVTVDEECKCPHTLTSPPENGHHFADNIFRCILNFRE